jgi:hypothetical protein
VGGIAAMPNPLPDTITRADLLAALEAFDGGAAHRFAESTGYDILFEGRRYPPKAIVGLAARAVTGVEYGPEDFSGGRGLTIEPASAQMLCQPKFEAAYSPRYPATEARKVPARPLTSPALVAAMLPPGYPAPIPRS